MANLAEMAVDPLHHRSPTVVLVPGIWLLLWSLGSGAAFIDQVLYIVIGFMVAMIAILPLTLFRRPLELWVAVGSGALAAAVTRVVIFGFAGRIPESGLISGRAILGGAVGGLTLWLLKSALSGTAHYEGDASRGGGS